MSSTKHVFYKVRTESLQLKLHFSTSIMTHCTLSVALPRGGSSELPYRLPGACQQSIMMMIHLFINYSP